MGSYRDVLMDPHDAILTALRATPLRRVLANGKPVKSRWSDLSEMLAS